MAFDLILRNARLADGGAAAQARMNADPALKSRVDRTLAWLVEGGQVSWFTPIAARHRRRRHSAKIVAGDVGEGERLVVTGPDGALSLEVRNLSELVRIAEGVDDATWSHHLREGDWSGWVRDAIGDDELAEAIEAIAARDLDPDASRRALRDELAARYPDLDAA